MTEPPVGLAIVDKAAGWTSHDVVARARRVLGTKKVGHSGTLDPDATGVLLLGVGSATRLLRFLTPLPKSYSGEVVLGVETSTLDAAGEVVATHDMAGATLDDLRAAAVGFVGAIDQVPPMVSAVQVGGQRLHALARQGIEIERQARPVTVHRFEVVAEVEPGVFSVEVDCSSGTYVRSLAADLGSALGGGAHLRRLRRTAIGPYRLERAVAVEDLERDRLRPPIDAVPTLDRVAVGGDLAARVAHGAKIPLEVLGVEGAGPWAVVDTAGALLAVYAAHGPDEAKPEVVLA